MNEPKLTVLRSVQNYNAKSPSKSKGGGNGGDDMSELQHRVARLEITTETLRDELRDFKNEVRGWRSDLAEDMREQRQDAKSLRYQVWGAALTVLLAMVGFIYPHTQSILAAIDTGRESTRAVEQIAERPAQQSPPPVKQGKKPK